MSRRGAFHLIHAWRRWMMRLPAVLTAVATMIDPGRDSGRQMIAGEHDPQSFGLRFANLSTAFEARCTQEHDRLIKMLRDTISTSSHSTNFRTNGKLRGLVKLCEERALRIDKFISDHERMYGISDADRLDTFRRVVARLREAAEWGIEADRRSTFSHVSPHRDRRSHLVDFSAAQVAHQMSTRGGVARGFLRDAAPEPQQPNGLRNPDHRDDGPVVSQPGDPRGPTQSEAAQPAAAGSRSATQGAPAWTRHPGHNYFCNNGCADCYLRDRMGMLEALEASERQQVLYDAWQACADRASWHGAALRRKSGFPWHYICAALVVLLVAALFR